MDSKFYICDIKKGRALPRQIYSFLGKKIKVRQDDFNWRRDYLVPVSYNKKSSQKEVKALLAHSVLREMERLNEKKELFELKNQGKQMVVRVYKIDLV